MSIFRCLVIIACCVLGQYLNAQPSGVNNKAAWQQLNRLEGNWQMVKDGKETWEAWKKLGDHWQGISFKVNGKDTTVLEKVMLHERNGILNYSVKAADNSDTVAVHFALVRAADYSFTFENMQHDFPQRVLYHFPTADSLHAWIEGDLNGKPLQQHFYYRKVR